MIIQRIWVLTAIIVAPSGFASFGTWLSQYRLGIDYTSSHSHVELNYRVDPTSSLPSSCLREYDQKMRCKANMYAGGASGFGLFLQRAFQRQGDWYLDADLGIGVRYLEGSLKKRPDERLPLRSASFSLGAVLFKPHIKIGYTPSHFFPDLFLSFGPALQIATGKASVNDENEVVAVGSSSASSVWDLLYGYIELEAVFYRFGDGALSIFSTRDFSDSKNGSRFFSKSVDGMDDIRASFYGATGGSFMGFGIKLLTTFP